MELPEFVTDLEFETEDPEFVSVQARVEIGIDFMDLWGPEEWRERIDPIWLDMGSSRWCVFGQVYGDYEDGLFESGLRSRHAPYAWQLGMDLNLTTESALEHETYAQ